MLNVSEIKMKLHPGMRVIVPNINLIRVAFFFL